MFVVNVSDGNAQPIELNEVNDVMLLTFNELNVLLSHDTIVITLLLLRSNDVNELLSQYSCFILVLPVKFNVDRFWNVTSNVFKLKYVERLIIEVMFASSKNSMVPTSAGATVFWNVINDTFVFDVPL